MLNPSHRRELAQRSVKGRGVSIGLRVRRLPAPKPIIAIKPSSAATIADPIRFHDEVITPFKGDLEVWYAQYRSLKFYLLIIYLTAASIINRKLVIIKYFEGLPIPPSELLAMLTEGQRAIFSKA